MKLKRANAILGLLLIALLLFHVIYQVWSYISFYYNPLVTKVIGYAFAGMVGLHAILAMLSVFVLSDAKGALRYPKENKGTLLQRLSAAGMLLLFPIHAQSGKWSEQHSIGHFVFMLVIIAQLLFWACLLIHISTSFSRALVTLGLLRNLDTKKKTDRCVFIVCLLIFLFAAVVVTRTQLFLYAMGGGQ